MAQAKIKLSRSLRKYIRREKARLRKTLVSPQEQAEAIKKLYQSLGFNFNPTKKNIKLKK